MDLEINQIQNSTGQSESTNMLARGSCTKYDKVFATIVLLFA